MRAAGWGRARLLGSSARNLILGVAYMLIVMTLATAGYVLAGWSLGDAAYMVVITVYTVGYDEVRPIDTTALRAITIATVVFGCTGMIFLTGALIQFVTLNQIKEVLGLRRMTQQIETLSDHVIICGLGRIGLRLAQELVAGRASFIVLDNNAARVAEAQDRGFLSVVADATEEAALREAGIERARALVTVLPSDAANVFITLSARSLNASLEIIARGEAPSTERKLLHAGANRVVLPTHIGAERIAEMILYPSMAALDQDGDRMRNFETVLRTLGLNMDIAVAAPGSPAVGRSVQWLEDEARGAFFVVRINRRAGETITHPDPSTMIETGDGLVLIGRVLGVRTLFEPGGRSSFRRSAR